MSVTATRQRDGVLNAKSATRNGAPPLTSEAVTANGPADDNGTTTAASRNTCAYCRRVVADDEPVWLLRRRTGQSVTRPDGSSYPLAETVWACRACALPRVPSYWHDNPFKLGIHERHGWKRRLIEPFVGQLYSQCDGCGRPLGRTNFWPDRRCSPACSRDARNRSRRRERVEHRCECGLSFTARADARYCSNACRQRAYRQRGGE
jgi:hypothetical protein